MGREQTRDKQRLWCSVGRSGAKEGAGEAAVAQLPQNWHTGVLSRSQLYFR